VQEIDYDSALDGILEADDRYQEEAYQFVREALEFTMDRMDEPELDSRGDHVTGQQLLLGARDYALEQYGPMVLVVFEQWGIHCCEDIGEVVYNLIEAGLFGKNEQDQKDDFSTVYDFEEAFAKPFLPKAKLPEEKNYGGRIADLSKEVLPRHKKATQKKELSESTEDTEASAAAE